MPYPLTPQDASDLDVAIAALYPQPLGGGELKQFAKLFTGQPLVNALTNILQPYLTKNMRPGVREELEINVGWIDKRPYAFMAGASKKGEIADGAVFSAHRWKHPGGCTIREARCILLQAKAIKDKLQLQNPTVSLNPAQPLPNSSTGRELRLMSTWPVFDFYPHAASKTPLVGGIDLQLAPGLAPPHGWFIGTPAVSPSVAQLQTWSQPWLCGPAVANAACTESLGSLLTRFFSGGQMPNVAPQPVDAGASFSYQYADITSPTQLRGFSRLCVEILRAIDTETISASWTNVVGVNKRQTQVLFSNPIQIVALTAYSLIRDAIQRLLFTKMPVLLVMRTSEEYPVNASPRRPSGPPSIFLG